MLRNLMSAGKLLLHVPVLLCGLSGLLSASTIRIDFTVVQDGQDYLYFSGNTLQWYHETFFANADTTIAASINSIAVPQSQFTDMGHGHGVWINGKTGSDSYTGFDTNPYTLPASLTLPAIVQTVTLTIEQFPGGSDTFAISQQPTAGNGYQLRVNFDDGPIGGTHTFQGYITFQGADPDPAPAPEPVTFSLLGVGLVVIGLVARKRLRR